MREAQTKSSQSSSTEVFEWEIDAAKVILGQVSIHYLHSIDKEMLPLFRNVESRRPCLLELLCNLRWTNEGVKKITARHHSDDNIKADVELGTITTTAFLIGCLGVTRPEEISERDLRFNPTENSCLTYEEHLKIQFHQLHTFLDKVSTPYRNVVTNRKEKDRTLLLRRLVRMREKIR